MYMYACMCAYGYECNALVCVCVCSGGEALSPLHAVLIEKWCLLPGGVPARGQAGGQAPKKEVTSIFIALDMHM